MRKAAQVPTDGFNVLVVDQTKTPFVNFVLILETSTMPMTIAAVGRRFHVLREEAFLVALLTPLEFACRAKRDSSLPTTWLSHAKTYEL
jgi:hypothetical protein